MWWRFERDLELDVSGNCLVDLGFPIPNRLLRLAQSNSAVSVSASARFFPVWVFGSVLVLMIQIRSAFGRWIWWFCSSGSLI